MDVTDDCKESFRKVVLSDAGDDSLFEALLASVGEWEVLGKGRMGAIIVAPYDDYLGNGGIPIVRTTTAYERPASLFQDVHRKLVESIQSKVSQKLVFNNALLEVYDSSYRKMGYHTDCSLDLEADSWICLFSVYEDARRGGLRTLSTLNKRTQQSVDVSLDHNSAVLFSTRANAAHTHKIVALGPPKANESRWLGVTLRFSKMRVHFGDDGVPRIGTSILTLATPQERALFIRCKGDENKTDGACSSWESNFTFTVSPSDLMKPLLFTERV